VRLAPCSEEMHRDARDAEDVRRTAHNPGVAGSKATINRLRAKLGDPPMIETVRERGYRIGGQ
jgi:DNA-binding response OmpR family regulator